MTERLEPMAIDVTNSGTALYRQTVHSKEPIQCKYIHAETETIKIGSFEFLGVGPDKGILFNGERINLKCREFTAHWKAGGLAMVKLDVFIDERVT